MGTKVPLTVAAEMQAVYAELRRNAAGTKVSDDQIVGRGLAIVQDTGTGGGPPGAREDILMQLAQTWAMYQTMLVEAVELTDRQLALGVRLRAEVDKTPRLQAKFRALQALIARRDPSLLDLRPGTEERIDWPHHVEMHPTG